VKLRKKPNRRDRDRVETCRQQTLRPGETLPVADASYSTTADRSGSPVPARMHSRKNHWVSQGNPALQGRYHGFRSQILKRVPSPPPQLSGYISN